MTDIKPGKKYFSVVYETTNPEAFQTVASKITGAMAEDLEEQGALVAACGWGDYATERDAFEYELLHRGIDTDEVVAYYIATELAEVGSFPQGQAFRDEVRNITG